ncbi:MAG: EpsG family protein [Eubacterium sp.]|nr:EpsG family protein [Eubacterium sp.]
MTELMPILVTSMIMTFLSQQLSTHNIQTNEYGRYEEKKEWFVYSILGIIMILFIGLRTKYNDTSTYVENYGYLTPDNLNIVDSFKYVDWPKIGSNPGFGFISCVLKYYGFSNQAYLMFFAVITIPIYLWFIRKYSSNLSLSMFLFFIVGSYLFCLAAIKQALAMALLLIATDKEIKNKHISFVFWVLIASTIHAYSWLYFIVPFSKFRPWTKKTYWSLLLFGLIGVALAFGKTGIINVSTLLGDDYTVESMSGKGVNIFRVGVTLVPTILSLLLKDKIVDEAYDDINCIIVNLSILHGELMFIALFGTANYFARLANYFEMFAVISIPWLIQFVNKKYRFTLTITAILLYLIYFWYGCMYSGFGTFDQEYERISLFEFHLH